MGIPQLHIDQLNTRYIMNLDHIQRQQAPTIISGGVHHWSFNKLTRGKLLKTKEWSEWRDAEWLQLEQYYSHRGCLETLHTSRTTHKSFTLFGHTWSRISMQE